MCFEQVSTMECGLLPITQEALVIHGHAGVSYHDYQGILINTAEKKDIQQNLGNKNKVGKLWLQGHLLFNGGVEYDY